MALTYEQESLRISKKASQWENKFKSLMKLKSENPKAWAKKRGWYENQLTHTRNMLKEVAPNLQKLESKEALRIKDLKEERAKLEQQVKAQESLVASRPNDPNIGQYRNMLKGSQSRLKAANIDLKNIDKRTQSKDLLNQLSTSEKTDIEQQAAIEETGAKLGGPFTPNSNLSEREKLNRQFGLNLKYVSQGGGKTVNLGENAVDFSAKPSKTEFDTKTTADLKIGTNPSEPTYKSDVHTIDPDTGEPRGVLTRSQAKAFDAKHQEKLKEWANKPGNELRIYKNHQGAG